MTKDKENPKLKTPLSQSAVEGLVSLTCECGAKFSRQKVDEHLMKHVYFKWKFRYCDVCWKARRKAALKRLPEIMKILAEAN